MNVRRLHLRPSCASHGLFLLAIALFSCEPLLAQTPVVVSGNTVTTSYTQQPPPTALINNLGPIPNVGQAVTATVANSATVQNTSNVPQSYTVWTQVTVERFNASTGKWEYNRTVMNANGAGTLDQNGNLSGARDILPGEKQVVTPVYQANSGLANNTANGTQERMSTNVTIMASNKTAVGEPDNAKAWGQAASSGNIFSRIWQFFFGE